MRIRVAGDLLVGAAIVLFYAWTASSSGNPFRWNGGVEQSGYYGLLTEAFSAGQVSLLIRPKPELLALPNPYDFRRNEAYRMHDMSLFHGRYYLYWGPAPVLTLFWPWHALFHSWMPENFAAFLFASGGFLFSWLAWSRLLRVAGLEAPWWLRGMSIAVLGLCGFVPHLLRRPQIYEVAIASAYCFLMAGFYLWLRGTAGGRVSPTLLALSGLCFGITVGSRVLFAIPVALMVGIAAWQFRRSRATLAFVVPLCLCGLAIAVYNWVRFGNPLDFGLAYQLAYVTVIEGVHPTFKKFAADAYYYLFSPPHFRDAFPLVHLPRVANLGRWWPAGLYVEEVVGLLSTTPVAILGMVFPWFLSRRELPLAAARFGLVAWAAGWIVFLQMTPLGWATLRYSVDFAPTWLLLGLFATVWLRPGRIWSAVFVVTCAWGMLVNVGISFIGYDNGLEARNPEVFDSLARTAARLGIGKRCIGTVNVELRFDMPAVPPTNQVLFVSRGGSVALESLSGMPATIESAMSRMAGHPSPARRCLWFQGHWTSASSIGTTPGASPSGWMA